MAEQKEILIVSSMTSNVAHLLLNDLKKFSKEYSIVDKKYKFEVVRRGANSYAIATFSEMTSERASFFRGMCNYWFFINGVHR